MFDGFVKVAAMAPKIKVADCQHNAKQICSGIAEAVAAGAKVIVFPELCITGYTCEDLFWQDMLLQGAKKALRTIVKYTEEKEGLIFVGMPWEKAGKLYNTAVAISAGEVLGVVPKRYLPNYGEFYEKRHFASGEEETDLVNYEDDVIEFGMNQLFSCENLSGLVVAAEICEDLWAPLPPSTHHALAGATIIVNLSASNEVVGKASYRKDLVRGQSARLVCGYVYAGAGVGESTTDLVFGGHQLIAENGELLAEAKPFTEQIAYGDIDVWKLLSERRKMTTFEPTGNDGYSENEFELTCEETSLTRVFEAWPFVPSKQAKRTKRCEEILMIQAMGLKKRLEHTGCKRVVLGLSGGLDSTLALLVTAKAFDLLDISRYQIVAVTMPCFGTTDRTYKNACDLADKLGAELREVDIKAAVLQHFKDINHEESIQDVTYENAQARERTQVLMDIANQEAGLVIGTGDLSELVLGWATYNGDHMSMYGVNSSVPKTLVRHLVRYYADTCRDEELSDILIDVLDTPVSPELLPSTDDEIAQKTEDLVGPYELHDFFIYHALRYGCRPRKIYRLAKLAFIGIYSEAEILKWLKEFYRRFFAQQFKRSCMPDGPKVGSVAVSPRGDLRMPSDACVRLWQDELEQL